MKLHMYKGMPNFGDVLNDHLWPHYLQTYLQRNDNILMFGIGTLLGQNVSHDGRIIVCGSGCGYEKNVRPVESANEKVFFVRGPLTAKILGLSKKMAITDPAIMTPDVFAASAPNGETLFIPHWQTSFNPLWPLACSAAGITYVNPLAPVEDVIAKISGAKLVITEAMHGAILADAYRVPWIPVSTSAHINRFKWTDWAKSLEVEPKLYSLSPLGFSDHFRDFTADKETAKILEKEVKNNGFLLIPETGQVPSELSLILSNLFQVIPGRFRTKLNGLLMSKLGPGLDRYIANELDKGRLGRHLTNAVDELHRLEKQSGWLSTDKVYDMQKSRVGEKIIEIRDYLNNN